MYKEIDLILKRYNYNSKKLLQILLDVQEISIKNNISQSVAIYIAEALDISLSQIDAMVNFFSVLSTSPRGKNIIRVCKSTSCMVNGHKNLLDIIKKELDIKIGETTKDSLFTLETTECIGACDKAPAFKINNKVYGNLCESKIKDILRSYKTIEHEKSVHFLSRNFGKYNSEHISEYIATGGFENLKEIFDQSKQKTIDKIKSSGLRGRGGAGYPTGKKLMQAKSVKGDRKILICNADEGEPGTFKDRQIIEKDPFHILEGMIITGYLINATDGYIYIRHEYNHLHRKLKYVIEKAREAGFLGKNILDSGFDFDIKVFSGAGSYVCGQGGALIESMEGKVGYPRTKPPYTKVKGLDQLPTLVINVETLATIASILNIGLEEFKKYGTKKSPGTKLISISGNVVNPGVFEVPFDITINEIINDLAKGSNKGDIKFIQIGGASGSLMPKKDFDLKLCYDELKDKGYGIGSGAIIVCNEDQRIIDYLETVYNFFEHESCGKCTPCREGSHIIAKNIRKYAKGEVDFDKFLEMKDIALKVKDSALCGLGQTSSTALVSALKHFENELRQEGDLDG